ncbi:hypothetical protein OR221_0867 [Microbacterium laevaniformans OR221]|nr:hypothetical protein OR221_0867 [Microbacterium laevaniformans OR221]
MASTLDFIGLAKMPVGVEPGSDLDPIILGRLIGVDPTNRAVQVTVAGSDPMWVRAEPSIYTTGGFVELERSPLNGGRIIRCLGPVDLVTPITAGKVTAINASAGTLTVETLGASFDITYNPGTYVVGGMVHVQRAPNMFGRPVHVLGPQGNFNGTDPGGTGGGSGNPGQLEQRQITISPQWTGSWTGSRWDNWNTDISAYGGRAALYQGQGYGSPNMQGLAVYGDQIVNLAAAEISKMTATLIRPDSGSGGGTGPAVLQTAHPGVATPGGGPGGYGATTSVGIGRGQVVSVDLHPDMYEAFRIGEAKGLALVGGSYLNLFGQDRAGAMTLTIQYGVIR